MGEFAVQEIEAVEEKVLLEKEALIADSLAGQLAKTPDPGFPSVDDVREAVAPYVKAGMQIVELTPVYFHFRHKTRECAGNLKCPLKVIVLQAQLIMPSDTVAPPT